MLDTTCLPANVVLLHPRVNIPPFRRVPAVDDFPEKVHLWLLEGSLAGAFGKMTEGDRAFDHLADYAGHATMRLVLDLPTGFVLAWSIDVSLDARKFAVMIDGAVEEHGSKPSSLVLHSNGLVDSALFQDLDQLGFLDIEMAGCTVPELLSMSKIVGEVVGKLSALGAFTAAEEGKPVLPDAWFCRVYIDSLLGQAVAWHNRGPVAEFEAMSPNDLWSLR